LNTPSNSLLRNPGLKKLPVNEIKIDRSFIVDILTDEASAQIVHAMIELAHHLMISIVAEGVEDQATWDALRALGCDLAQGYYISRPLSAEALTKWLENQHTK
jgi:EAL domain-containing protein (putative c-di-GMP-specific phosphodiesterase class I)